MSIVGMIVRRYLTRKGAEQVRREIAGWRESGMPPAEYARGRAPELVNGLPVTNLADLKEFVARWTGTGLGDRDSSSRSHRERASELSASAEAAQRRLEALEVRAEKLAATRQSVDDVRAEAEARVDELVGMAHAETERRVEEGRKRLAELESQAALHVEDVERRSRLAATSVVAETEARYSSAESRLLAELDRARLDARLASERAEAAVRRSQRADEADGQGGRNGDRNHRSRSRRLDIDHGDRQVDTTIRSLIVGDLNDMDRSELYALARELGISGRSSMNRSDLVDAIESNG